MSNKLRFYVDFWPGIDITKYGISAHTKPLCTKGNGCKRVAFDVEIPADLLFDVDVIAPEVDKVEVV